MKRVLLVSYGFPPVSRVNSQGAAKQARGLAERGWEVHVLTVADPPTFLFDPSLAEDLPAGVIVHAAWSLEPTRVFQLLRRVSGREKAVRGPAETSAAARRNYTSLPQWAVTMFRSLFFPDEKIGWSPWAVGAAVRLHRELRFDAVISTGPPYSDHVIGRRIARRTGVPWLAVLMDPVVGCYAFPPVTRLHGRLFRRLERAIAREASAIAIATRPWAQELVERNPGCRERVFLFPNSFEPGAFEGPPPAGHDGFLVAYVGTFQLSIRPDDLLDAAVSLKRDPGIAGDLRVRLVSPLDPQTDEAVAARGLEDFVERTGLVEHAEAVAEMRGADVLVLILGPEPASKGILTGKLPEYLAAGRPVLAIAPEGVATATIRRAGAGDHAEPGDVAGVESVLRRFHADWRAGRVPGPDPAVVSEFDRSRTVARLGDALDALREGRAIEAEVL